MYVDYYLPVFVRNRTNLEHINVLSITIINLLHIDIHNNFNDYNIKYI